MKRLLTIAAAVAMAFSMNVAMAEEGVTDTEIKLVGSGDLSGNLKGLTEEARLGAEIYFRWVNDNGGINGRKVNYIEMNDQYKPDIALENAKKRIEGPEAERPFVWFAQFGTGASTKVLPYTSEKKIPFLFPYSGSPALRNQGRYVFNFRASYEDEMAQIADYVVASGIKDIAVIYQDDPFGKAGLAGVEKALEKKKMALKFKKGVKNDGSDTLAAVPEFTNSGAKAVIISAAGNLVSEFLKDFTAKDKSKTKVFGMSVLSPKKIAGDVGKKSYGISVAQILPHPLSNEYPFVAEARNVFGKYNIKSENITYTMLEGYMNAKLFSEAAKAAGRDLTREKFVSAMENLPKDIGGVLIGFSPSNHDGAHVVDLSMISKSGEVVE